MGRVLKTVVRLIKAVTMKRAISMSPKKIAKC